MAVIKLPISSPPCGSTIRPVRTTNTTVSQLATMNSKKNNQSGPTNRTTFSPPVSSPFHAAESLASRIGLEIAVADLERLFASPSSPSGGNLPPLPFSPHRRRRPPVRVAYQGVRGSYCQEAVARAFSGEVDAFPCDAGMESVFSAVEVGEADRAVVPVENSLDGIIPRNLDLLLRHAGSVKIVGELVLPVNHCLLTLPGTKSDQIRRVVSHPQALSHCSANLDSMDLDLVEEVQNPADAARYLAENLIPGTAVIGSEMAAKEFGLEILRRNLQDRPGNFNRFLQLGLESPAVSGDGEWKTAVAFSLEKGPSGLFEAMWAFETRGVKVNRVDHRPDRSNPIRVSGTEGSGYFNYVYLFDVAGSESDPVVRSAIARLREVAGFVRVLGTYTATCGAASC